MIQGWKRALICPMLFVQSLGFGKNLDKQTVIGDLKDFVILSDVNKPEIEIFLSYSGKWNNRCGIAFRHSVGATAYELKSVLLIKSSSEVGEIENGQLVANVSAPDAQSFGEFFKISTRSGLPLNEVISKLSAHQKIDVIVENLPCK